LNCVIEGLGFQLGAREFWDSQKTNAPPSGTGVAVRQ